ncbi:hypothetical protein QFC20_005677 [Naganishia adeliensis]|uniref:Uncharacterized protein n=1 Tax=Naganishia adeliensis TaxID=92952 RepID=A0ACC2VKY0_9TREE|nr:hypothetical protein QFC20_005677 [Naganishia adeliensis]
MARGKQNRGPAGKKNAGNTANSAAAAASIVNTPDEGLLPFPYPVTNKTLKTAMATYLEQEVAKHHDTAAKLADAMKRLEGLGTEGAALGGQLQGGMDERGRGGVMDQEDEDDTSVHSIFQAYANLSRPILHGHLDSRIKQIRKADFALALSKCPRLEKPHVHMVSGGLTGAGAVALTARTSRGADVQVEGVEVFRNYNRGLCEGPVCPHGRKHVCDQYLGVGHKGHHCSLGQPAGGATYGPVINRDGFRPIHNANQPAPRNSFGGTDSNFTKAANRGI